MKTRLRSAHVLAIAQRRWSSAHPLSWFVGKSVRDGPAEASIASIAACVQDIV